MADQLSFDWPTGVALGPDDFFVAPANTQAFAMITDPGNWPARKLVITGPAGCGKSHLVGIFRVQSDAILLQAADLPPDIRPDGGTVIVEDMQHLPATSEEAMFHLHNHLTQHAGTLLMTAQTAPSRWAIALPDLASRMQATTVAQISDPDDALLQALIMKLFADRQIMPPPGLAGYLAPRIERSFAAAADVVAKLDATSLAQGRRINITLARAVLDNTD